MKREAKWWEKEPLLIMEPATTWTDIDQRDPVAEAEKIAALGGNMTHVHVKWPHLDPARFYFSARTATRKNRDYLAEFLAEAHKRDIRTVIYFDVHTADVAFGRRHPDWRQLTEDGKPKQDVYTVHTTFCVNSPWRDWVFETVEDLCKYDIDGIFFDGPVVFEGCCYCESCRKLFRKTYGKKLPLRTVAAKRKDSAQWANLVEFQSKSVARFLRDTQKRIKRAHPGILFYMNGNVLAPYSARGADNRKLIRETDMLGAEGGFLHGDLRNHPIFKPALTAKLLESQAAGKPTVVFDCGGHKPWTFSALPVGETELLFAQTIAHSANVWFALCGEPAEFPEQVEVMQRYNAFIKKNREVYIGTRSDARIALAYSQDAANFYAASGVAVSDFTKAATTEKAGDVMTEFNGFYDALLRGQWPFDVIDDVNLDSGVDSRYDLLVMPNIACLSAKAARNVKKFVAAGGNLIVSFETSLYNARGKKLKNFQLADVMGVDCAGGVFGPLQWDYLFPQGRRSPLLKGIESQYVPSPNFGLKTKSREDARTCLTFAEPLPGRYAGDPSKSDMPFLVQHKFGKGTCIYLAADFGNFLWKFRLEECYRILWNAVSRLHRSPVRLEGLPRSVDISIRKKDTRTFIHLVNCTSEVKRPVANIVPVARGVLVLKRQKPLKQVRALMAGKDLKWKSSGQEIRISLPTIGAYEVVALL
jgi:hypothetical protein